MIEFITDLFKCGTTKVADVIRHIEYARTENGLFACEVTPKKRQIEYLLRKFRNAEVPPMVKLGDLNEWCEQNSTPPLDVNQAFVIDSKFSSHEEDLSFGFTISTLALLKKLSDQETICVDATYKLNWHGFPLVVVGTVDRAKRFHPVLYACCSHERSQDYKFVFESAKKAIKQHLNKDFKPKVLIADGADAIRNAFYESFESAELDIMCFAHVIRNCRKRPFVSKNNKQLILDDIRKTQHASNRTIFNMMTTLFCDKWREIETDFVTYFEKEWLGVHCNWFEGAAQYTPSTNNGLESHNAVIKKKITLRRRLPMNQFLACMLEMATDIAIQFSKNEHVMEIQPAIKKLLYEKASIMIKENFKSFKAKQSNSNATIFSIPSSACASENATIAYFKTIKKTTWKSFDEFIIYGHQQFYVLSFSSSNWKSESTCTCTGFFKQNICKHIIAIGIQLGAVELPESANSVAIAPTRRKAGRPKTTTNALRLQN